MSTGKIIGYIVAGIILLFGVLYLLSAFSAETLNPGGRLLVGGVLVLVGLGIIVAILPIFSAVFLIMYFISIIASAVRTGVSKRTSTSICPGVPSS